MYVSYMSTGKAGNSFSKSHERVERKKERKKDIFIHFHPSMALQPFVGPWPLLQFRNLFYTDGRTPWTSNQPVARPLPTHRTTQTQNKRTHTQTSMPRVGFEPTIPASERAKTVQRKKYTIYIFHYVFLPVILEKLSEFWNYMSSFP
jgi:hypothetical protein